MWKYIDLPCMVAPTDRRIINIKVNLGNLNPQLGTIDGLDEIIWDVGMVEFSTSNGYGSRIELTLTAAISGFLMGDQGDVEIH